MKKVLLAIAAVATITSCSQNEEFENPTQKAEINVSTVVKTTSRAAVTNNENFTAFKVSSFIVANDFDFSTTLLGDPYMDGVSYKGKKGSWTTDDVNKYYWPTDKNVQFFGYPEGCTLTTPTKNGYPTLTFTIGENSSTQTDLVVASENMSKSAATNNTATLNFKHVLTKINFSYKPEDTNYDYKITEIKIVGAKGGEATYTFNKDVIDGTWSDGVEVAEGYTYSIANTLGSADAGSYYALDSADGSLMLLPQNVKDVKINITYTTKKTINAVEETFFSGTKVVTLPSGSWGVGKSIRYKLTLPVGAEKIGIATEVKDWSEETSETPNIDSPVI